MTHDYTLYAYDTWLYHTWLWYLYITHDNDTCTWHMNVSYKRMPHNCTIPVHDTWPWYVHMTHDYDTCTWYMPHNVIIPVHDICHMTHDYIIPAHTNTMTSHGVHTRSFFFIHLIHIHTVLVCSTPTIHWLTLQIIWLAPSTITNIFFIKNLSS